MNGGKDVRERNVGNKGKEGFEYSRKKEWKIGKEREYYRIEG